MGTHRLILIRADGNHNIASGHLVRCLSIALACQSCGMEICFLVSQGESLSLLRGLLDTHNCVYHVAENLCETSGGSFFTVIPLKTARYDQSERELPEVLRLLHTLPCRQESVCTLENNTEKPVYLLDSYYVTEKYLSSLRPHARVAYLDDLQLFDYPVDLLINYDVIPEGILPSCQAVYQNSGRLLLGASYAPLRSQFQNRECPVGEQVKAILITTGGSDPCHLCLHLAQAFLQTEEEKRQTIPVTIHMVLGRLNTDREALQTLADRLPFLQLHENVTDMASLMQSCDLAISAAGTTLYELCALGVPTLSFSMADNQIPPARAFAAVGAIPWAGDIRLNFTEVMDTLLDFMTDMSQKDSFSRRKSAHEAMRRLVDGNGTFRIAKALSEL